MSKELGSIFVIAAASGTGKSSLADALVTKLDGIVESVSHTTRVPRPSEKEGAHYHFVNEAEFIKLRDGGAFIEHARVFDNWYGTAKQTLMDTITTGQDVLLVIDWQGARQVKALFAENCVTIFLLPPSGEGLKSRLEKRAQDDAKVIASRLDAARGDMSHYLDFDYLVVNDDFDETLATLQSIVIAKRHTLNRQQHRHAKLLESLLGTKC